METWKPIPNYESLYEVSDLGNIRRSAKRHYYEAGGLMKQNHHKRQYMIVGLRSNGKTKQHLVHRLVMAAFVGECPEGHEVDHIDGDKTNNRLENLEYVTRQENSDRAIAMGLRDNKGEKHGRSKLTEQDVRDIKDRLWNGESQSSIAADYPVGTTTISHIYTGFTWKHI
tara:strand:+ start:216 stop:725 length:510 start_codon:yes stop_codon:yes gene_type:complete